MKIRIDINDSLLRRAKAEAARRGCSVDALVEEGLTFVVNARPKGRAATPEAKLLAKRRRMLDKIVAANQRMGLYDD